MASVEAPAPRGFERRSVALPEFAESSGREGSPQGSNGSTTTADLFAFPANLDRPERDLVSEFTDLTTNIFGHRYDSRVDSFTAFDQLPVASQRTLLEKLLVALSRYTVAFEGTEGERRRSVGAMRRATLHSVLESMDFTQQRRLTLRLQQQHYGGFAMSLSQPQRAVSPRGVGERHASIMELPHFGQSSSSNNAPFVKMTQDARVLEDEEEDGILSINNFTILDVLGRGSQGTVYLAFDETVKEFRAIKAIKKPMATSESMRQLQAEISIMVKLRHPNIVALHEVINPPQSKTLYLVMQYVEKGTIVEYTDDTHTTCKPHEPGPFLYAAKQLLSALQYLHKGKIYHQDIKPENILCGLNEQVYLADFGVAETFKSFKVGGFSALGASLSSIDVEGSAPLPTRMRQPSTAFFASTSGTPAFYPPEKLSEPNLALSGSAAGGGYRESDSAAADVWALGVSFYFLLVGKMPFGISTFLSESVDSNSPFTATSLSQLAKCVSQTPLEFPPGFGPGWVIVLSGMLEKNPRRRLSAKEAMALLERVDSTSLRLEQPPSPQLGTLPFIQRSTVAAGTPSAAAPRPLDQESLSLQGQADSPSRGDDRTLVLPVIPSPPSVGASPNAPSGRKLRITSAHENDLVEPAPTETGATFPAIQSSPPTARICPTHSPPANQPAERGDLSPHPHADLSISHSGSIEPSPEALDTLKPSPSEGLVKEKQTTTVPLPSIAGTAATSGVTTPKPKPSAAKGPKKVPPPTSTVPTVGSSKRLLPGPIPPPKRG
jgi:serine/threonine protein kinase